MTKVWTFILKIITNGSHIEISIIVIGYTLLLVVCMFIYFVKKDVDTSKFRWLSRRRD